MTDAAQPDKASTAEQILDAAERVVARDGAHLTIDAVVKESGFSKGGVLYNFPSKLELIKGMVARMTARFLSRHEAAKPSVPQNSSNVLHDMVLEFFPMWF